MSVSWRLEAKCSSFSFLQGDGLSVRPAPPWRQAPVRSWVLDRPLRVFGTLSPPQTNLPTLATRRHQLQHVADGEYPFTDPANAGMRRKFDLSPDRPLNP
jgi:hypothetical protein